MMVKTLGGPLIFDANAIAGFTRSVPTSESVTTERRAKLRNELIERDGTCVLTGLGPLDSCRTLHIIPPSKGDDVSGVYQLEQDAPNIL
jgi:hypothetical protein